MADNDLEQRARESIAAFNRSDWEALRGMAGPDYVYEETGTGLRLDGVEATIEALRSWKASAPDAVGEVTRVLTSGDVAAVEIIWRGTQTGPMETPAGVLPASGRPFEFYATMWQQWRQGRLAAERHHLDMLTLLGQLGALPDPGAA